MVTFGLVHGAYHGSWCWGKLIPELERRNHQVLTVDLPSEDPQAGAAEYAAAALTAFGGAGDDLVVVGHSLAGLTIPLIAAARPVRQLIFVAGMLPRPGKTQQEVLRAEPDMVFPGPEGGAYRGPGGDTRWRPDAAAHWFFADCSADVAAWAASRLRPVLEDHQRSHPAVGLASRAVLLRARHPRPGDQPSVVTTGRSRCPWSGAHRTRWRTFRVPGDAHDSGPDS
jgi:alpha/beta hydrolase family protein